MLSGAHSIIYSTNAAADRAFLRDVLKLPNVDVGDGWLIFGLPPAEIAVHPSEKNDVHEFYFMTEDVAALIAEMSRHGLSCTPVHDAGWGLLTQLTLPGGGKLGIYQARHARPETLGAAPARAARKPAARRAAPARKPAKKSAARRPGKKKAKGRGGR